MASFRQKLISSLKTDFLKINNYGYSTIVKDVFVGAKEITSVDAWPSISFFIDNDILIDEDASSDLQTRVLDLKIIVYVKANLDPNDKGKVTDLIERSYVDIYNFLYRGRAISDKTKTASFRLNPDCKGISITEKLGYVESEESFGAGLITCKVEYTESALDINNEIVSATNNLANA